MDLLPELKVMVLARLQIRDIARIKLVCREWKSLLESSYFREVYKTINQKNLSSPWSILYTFQISTTALEFFCERWGFKQSLGSCVSRFLDKVKVTYKTKRMSALAITDGLILLGVWTSHGPEIFSVANPVLQQWINIPQPSLSPPRKRVLQGVALVTNMNNGDLLGYKVVQYDVGMDNQSLYFEIYSSDSGIWTCHNVATQDPIAIFENLPSKTTNLNGYLHWLFREDRALVAHNFYASTGICHVIELPQLKHSYLYYKETLTISCGSLMFINIATEKPNHQLNIWKLKNYTSGSCKDSWELLWNLRPGPHLPDLYFGLITDPVAMHPFDKEIIYLVRRQSDCFGTHSYLVTCNLRNKKFQFHKDWKLTQSGFIDYNHYVLFHQFVLPQRLGSIPCPPGCTLATLPGQQH